MLSLVRALRLTQAPAAARCAQALTRLTLVLQASGASIACKGEFDGPYPCEHGYASCVSPEQNLCETDTTTDAANCGACGHACDVGALCSNSNCLTGAQKLTPLSVGQVPRIAVNSTGLFWGSSGQSQIMTVSALGGTPTVAAEGVYSCGNNGLPFALDEKALYFASNSVPCTTNSCANSGVVSVAVSTGTQTVLSQVQSMQNFGCPSGYALDSSRLYWTENQSSSSLIFALPLSGGTPTTLATVDTQLGSIGSDLMVTQSQLLFTASQNGPWELQAIPKSGTTLPPIKIPLFVNGQSFGLSSFLANDSFIFVATGGCPCDDTGGGNGFPSGRIDRFSLDGSGGINLAQFSGLVNGMALDADSLYFVTESNLWKVAISSGSPRMLAGNLLGGGTPTLCDYSCASQLIPTVSLAVDSQYVYIADAAPNVKAILKVHK